MIKAKRNILESIRYVIVVAALADTAQTITNGTSQKNMGQAVTIANTEFVGQVLSEERHRRQSLMDKFCAKCIPSIVPLNLVTENPTPSSKLRDHVIQ